MLVQVSHNLIVNIDKILSVEKSIRCSIVIYFYDRQDPCSYFFASYDERDSIFEKIIKASKKELV